MATDRRDGVMKEFFAAQAKVKVKEAVVAIEAKSSAEIVVTVRERSALYRDVDYLVGAVFGLATLVAVIFDPAELDERLFPVEVVVAFAVGAALSAFAVGTRLVTKIRKRAEVSRAARAAFHDQKIAGTSRRRGILIYVSALEHMVELVTDVGVPDELVRKDLESARVALELAVEKGSLGSFMEKMTSLGELLARELPRGEGDTNELSDEVA